MKAAPRSSRPRTAALSPGSRSAETRSPGSGISPHGRWLRSLALSPGCAEALQRCRTWFLTVDRGMEQVVVLPVLRCVCVWLSVIWTHTDSVHTLSSGCLLSRFWHTCSHPALVARMQRTLRGTELEPYYYSGFYIRSRERIFKVSSDRVRVFTLEPECGTHF